MPPVLSIDFGSAFTKVALRRESDEATKILDEPTLHLTDPKICIPTIAASAVRNGVTRWAFGMQAAGFKPGNGVRVYRNWKPQLFGVRATTMATTAVNASPSIAADAGNEAAVGSDEEQVNGFLAALHSKTQERALLVNEIASHVGTTVQEVDAEARRCAFTVEQLRRAVAKLRPPASSPSEENAPVDVQEVAVHYFRWLRDFLAKSCEKHTSLEIAKIPVRVCVPAFGTSNRLTQPSPAESVLLWVLRKAGWALHESHPLVPEPTANAVGWLTEGVNKVRPVLNGRDRMLDWEKMVGQGAFLNALQNRPKKQTKYVVLVVDVGAYTTDCAALDFDPTDMEVPHFVTTHSDPLGVDDLDKAVTAALPTALGTWFGNTGLSERELFKQSVYAAEQAYWVGKVELDQPAIQRIHDAIRHFAEQVRERVVHFLDNNGFRRVQEVILTGGGMNIPRIQSALVDGLRKRGVLDFHLPRPKGDAKGVFDQRLLRGAGALGGASVYFDYLV